MTHPISTHPNPALVTMNEAGAASHPRRSVGPRVSQVTPDIADVDLVRLFRIRVVTFCQLIKRQDVIHHLVGVAEFNVARDRLITSLSHPMKSSDMLLGESASHESSASLPHAATDCQKNSSIRRFFLFTQRQVAPVS